MRTLLARWRHAWPRVLTMTSGQRMAGSDQARSPSTAVPPETALPCPGRTRCPLRARGKGNRTPRRSWCTTPHPWRPDISPRGRECTTWRQPRKTGPRCTRHCTPMSARHLFRTFQLSSRSNSRTPRRRIFPQSKIPRRRTGRWWSSSIQQGTQSTHFGRPTLGTVLLSTCCCERAKKKTERIVLFVIRNGGTAQRRGTVNNYARNN